MEFYKKMAGFALAALVFLPGCIGVQRYQRRDLQEIANNADDTQTQDGVTLRVKRLSGADKDYLFNGRMKNLDDAEIIYLSIYNLTPHGYTLAPKDVFVKQLGKNSARSLIKKTSSFARLGGIVASTGVQAGAGALVCHSAAVGCGTTAGGAFVLGTGLTSGVLLGVGAAVFYYVFLANMIKSIVMNRRIDKDIEENLFHKEVIIQSGGYYEGLIFVNKSNYHSNFMLTVRNEFDKKNKLTFDVACA